MTVPWSQHCLVAGHQNLMVSVHSFICWTPSCWVPLSSDITFGIRSASEHKLEQPNERLVLRGQRNPEMEKEMVLDNTVSLEKLRDEKPSTSHFLRIMLSLWSGLINTTTMKDVCLSRKPAAYFWVLLKSLASWLQRPFLFHSQGIFPREEPGWPWRVLPDFWVEVVTWLIYLPCLIPLGSLVTVEQPLLTKLS